MPKTANLVVDRPVIAQGLYSFRTGGSERIGAQLCIEYAARGYRVVCFAFHGRTGPFRDYLESHGIECVDLDYLARPPIVRRFTYPVELWHFFRSRQVRAIHVQHAMALTLCGRAARYAGVKHVVMTEHDIFQLDEQPKYRRRAAHCCRYASSITGVHSGITEYFHDRMCVPKSRLRVVPNGVPTFTPDAEKRRLTRAALGVDEATFVCLYVGRLEAVKGLHTLVNAAARLTEPGNRPMRVFLAGNGSERAALESQCRSQNLTSSVTFLGERSDIHDLLNMADAFVMTSRTEGLPMALIEAMAAGLPCVATAVGGIPAVLSGDAGILVPPEDPESVAEALMRLAGDDLMRRQLAERALRKVHAQYGLQPVVSAYLELLGLPAHWPPEQ